MIDLLKNAFLMGIGMSAITREKISDFAKKISENATVSEEEGQKVIDEFVEQIKNSRKNLDELVNTLISEALNKLNIPSRDEYNEYERRLSKLEAAMNDDKQTMQ